MSNEEEIVKGCIKGDRVMQKKLYEYFCKRMYVIAMRYSKGQLEAEDTLQEAFIKIFENIKTFRQECPLEQWIKRIVIHTALKQNRSKLYMYPASDIDELEETLQNSISIHNYEFQELLNFIQNLAPRYQIVFNLYAIEGYQHKEIAEMLGITENTSKSQYARAKVMLQDMIKQDDRMSYEKSK